MKVLDRACQVRRRSMPRGPSFSVDLIRAIAGVGLVAAIASGCGIATARGPAPQHEQTAEADKLPHNPFAEIRGLPHRVPWCGTGQPCRLTSEMAREVIERVFRDHGYELTRDCAYRKGNVAFTADGYDESSGAGYVFTSGERLSDDAYISWLDVGKKKGDRDAQRRRLGIRAKRLNEELAKLAEDVIAKDGEAFDAALAEWVVAYDAERLSMSEIRKVSHRGPKRGEFIAIVSPFDRRYEFLWEGKREQSDRERELFEEFVIERDATTQERIRDEIWKEIAREALENLERDVRDYICWARSQGLP